MTKNSVVSNLVLGLVMSALTVSVIVSEWLGSRIAEGIADALLVAMVVAALPRLSRSRLGFVTVAVALAVVAFLSRSDWSAILMHGLERGGFIAAFFVALAMLRIPSMFSPAIERCGLYLASRPPGRRYLALTIGGHLFALLLNYGSITLLGGLVESIGQREKNEAVRAIRNRRMLLAIQRGFASSLCWSPLAFAMAISTSIIPGSSWSGAVAFGVVSSCIVAGTGWALDTLVKPRLSGPRPAAPAMATSASSWRDLYPLLILLLILGVLVGGLEVLTRLAVTSVVMLVVPVISLAWLALQGQARREPGGRYVFERLGGYVLDDLPSYAPEAVLLIMAGFIGAVGGSLLAPLVQTDGASLGAMPPMLLLVAIVWLIPIAGQLGMNPILAVSLAAPFLVEMTGLGIPPNAAIVAITAGWSLSAVTSPFTATVLLIGRLGGVTPLRVGWGWNGSFIALAGVALSAWVILVASLF
ncbi:hypothetical protein [Consotaella aegiceratis]|uniref:hypothetical protein n=1 Tax=Consotaella aegiceratis TaxID=3097961 RepID=UPI002F4135B8